MASLFDLAAELGQFGDGASASAKCEPLDPPPRRGNQDDACSSVLLLDETLQTIFDARRTTAVHKLKREHSAPVLSCAEPARTTISTSSALPVPPHSLVRSATTLACDAHDAPASLQTPRASSTVDSDLDARRALREISDEIDNWRQLKPAIARTQRDVVDCQRALRAKFLDQRLDQLAPTPFVQLARRKIQQKIAQLDDLDLNGTPVIAATNPAQLVTPSQHLVLQKLQSVPDPQVARLTRPQQDIVRFAKQYDRILRMTPSELERLPVTQQQLLQQLRQQMHAAKSTH